MNITDRLNAIENSEVQIFKTITKDGRIEYKNSKGQLYNINDLPAVVHSKGYKAWFKNGIFCGDNDCCP